MKLLLAPHDDDVELFAAYTAIRELPRIVICLDSYVQPERGFIDCAARMRAHESELGIRELDSSLVIERLRIPDNISDWQIRAALIETLPRFTPEHVWAPAIEAGGHPHHNLLGRLADDLWGVNVTHYLTYTLMGKSRHGIEVKPESGKWIAKKLRAMSRHESQLRLDPKLGCWPHFTRGIEEYYQR